MCGSVCVVVHACSKPSTAWNEAVVQYLKMAAVSVKESRSDVCVL